MIAVLEQQVRENYEEALTNSRVDQSNDLMETMDFEEEFSLDELWNFYLDFCVKRLVQASDSSKSEVRFF